MTDVVMHTYTIFERPDDYPDGYVVRRFDILRGGDIRLGPAVCVASLELARAEIPGHLDLCCAPEPTDDPSIVETWL